MEGAKSGVVTCSGDEVDMSAGQSPKEWQTGGACEEAHKEWQTGGQTSDGDESEEGEQVYGEQLALEVFGEQLEATQARVREESPFAELPTWRLVGAIVKSGDSFLQERLALQLISEMAAVFDEAGLPIRLYPYKVPPGMHASRTKQGKFAQSPAYLCGECGATCAETPCCRY